MKINRRNLPTIQGRGVSDCLPAMRIPEILLETAHRTVPMRPLTQEQRKTVLPVMLILTAWPVQITTPLARSPKRMGRMEGSLRKFLILR